MNTAYPQLEAYITSHILPNAVLTIPVRTQDTKSANSSDQCSQNPETRLP